MIELNHEMILNLLPDRSIYAHKGDFGKVLLLCGSIGYTGAAALAAMGALRTGSGLVYLGVPESIYAIEAVKLTEPVVLPLRDQNGMYAASAAEQVSELLPKMDAVLFGPGVGQSEGVFDLLTTVLNDFHGPVILDADGINLMAKHMHLLRGRKAPTILTPHAGEFARIGGSIEVPKEKAAEHLAREFGCIIVLKGHHTVITDGRLTYRNLTGNPGMAVGGSGDLLAGVIVSLLGQGLEPLQAAAAGTWLHGAAGDICAAKLGQYGMLPTDMLNELPRLMK